MKGLKDLYKLAMQAKDLQQYWRTERQPRKFDLVVYGDPNIPKYGVIAAVYSNGRAMVVTPDETIYTHELDKLYWVPRLEDGLRYVNTHFEQRIVTDYWTAFLLAAIPRDISEDELLKLNLLMLIDPIKYMQETTLSKMVDPFD